MQCLTTQSCWNITEWILHFSYLSSLSHHQTIVTSVVNSKLMTRVRQQQSVEKLNADSALSIWMMSKFVNVIWTMGKRIYHLQREKKVNAVTKQTDDVNFSHFLDFTPAISVIRVLYTFWLGMRATLLKNTQSWAVFCFHAQQIIICCSHLQSTEPLQFTNLRSQVSNLRSQFTNLRSQFTNLRSQF